MIYADYQSQLDTQKGVLLPGAGYSVQSGKVVVDMGRMNKVTLAPGGATATIQAGVRQATPPPPPLPHATPPQHNTNHLLPHRPTHLVCGQPARTHMLASPGAHFDVTTECEQAVYLLPQMLGSWVPKGMHACKFQHILMSCTPEYVFNYLFASLLASRALPALNAQQHVPRTYIALCHALHHYLVLKALQAKLGPVYYAIWTQSKGKLGFPAGTCPTV